MRIVSVTTVKNEGPWLLEWVAWQRLIGVSDIIVVSNDCSDGTDAILNALAEGGGLLHLRNPARPGKSLQWQALKAAWAHPLRKAADWMLISDLDEFPVVHRDPGTLPALVAALPEGIDAVALPWRLFGNAGQVMLVDQPVTGQFTRAAPSDMIHPVAATYMKALFRPAAFARPGIHRPGQKADRPAPNWVDGGGVPFPAEIAANDKRISTIGLAGGRALVEMHHYSLRSLEAFVVKAARGLPNRTGKAIDLHYWVERNFNTEENTAALQHGPALRDGIAALMALPGVAALHRAAVGWHQAEFLRLVATTEGYRLFCACMHAGGSEALGPQTDRKLLQMFQRLPRQGAGQPALKVP